MDSAWVRVLLLDDNDNAPRFTTNLVNLTLPEDAPLGHSLASFTATDIDQVSSATSNPRPATHPFTVTLPVIMQCK